MSLIFYLQRKHERWDNFVLYGVSWFGIKGRETLMLSKVSRSCGVSSRNYDSQVWALTQFTNLQRWNKWLSVSNVALKFLHKGGTKEREERMIIPCQRK